MKIGITIGDPNGIGLETLFKSLTLITEEFKTKNELLIYGNEQVISDYFEKNNYSFEIQNNYLIIQNCHIKIVPTYTKCNITFGKVEEKAGLVSYESLQKSIIAIKMNEIDALVTLPISKHSTRKAGFNFPGQTEFFAYFDKAQDFLMILFNDLMKVSLATIHEPLTKVKDLLNDELIIKKIILFNKSLKNDFKIENAKISVLGLNPHSGENGDIGTEEIDIIIPALEKLIEQDINLEGPFPADAFFGQHIYKNSDGIFAIYHDQGLIPMKMTSINGGVNFTAGLSFVRTSPDHGTGFDIAGMNIADPKSTYQAILWAEKIYKNRKTNI